MRTNYGGVSRPYRCLGDGYSPQNRPLQTEQPFQEDWPKDTRSMPLWRGGPNTRTLPTALLTPSASKAVDMAHLCVPQNQALGVYRGFVPDIQVCGTHGREDLVNANITSNAEVEEKEEEESGTFLFEV